ncbi:hypothetical protein B566_EDAN016447 [Ephemera danica]|nr:hypothetical protein B566_EDAN016447 [Ephemera danica]
MACGDSGFSEFAASAATEDYVQTGLSQGPSTSSQKEESMDKQDTDEKDEVSSTMSDLSELSGLSDLSGQDWKPVVGPMSWVQRQMQMGTNPRDVLAKLGNLSNHIPCTLDDTTLWKIIVSVLSEPPRREKLRHVNTLLDIVRLLRGAQKILILTGAGVSVSCGIPDFRSRDGIYSRLAIDFPDLPDPQAMFDINYFRQDPRPFYKFAREIYPGQFKPSPCHRFIKSLERRKKLLRNYTQNIDTLEQVAGIENVIECHGSFATASCTRCKAKVSADVIREDILEQRIPKCAQCSQLSAESLSKDSLGNEQDYFRDLFNQGIMKPDIVFFGEGLPDAFHQAMASDKDECDLLIVIGSSLKVRPVALIPSSIPSRVPQILINREPLPHLSFDVELLGDSDVIINQLCHIMGGEWSSECWQESLQEVHELEPCAVGTNWKLHPEEDTLLPSCSSDSGVCHSGSVTPALAASSATDRGRHLSIESMQSASDSGIAVGALHQSPEHTEAGGAGRDSRQLSTESMQSATMDSEIGMAVTGHSSSGVSQSPQPSEGSGAMSRHMSVDSAGSPSPPMKDEDDLDELRTSWEPKARESLAERLPENSYYYHPPSRYIFPGAEVYYEPDEDKCSTSSDSEDETNQSAEEDNGYWEEEAFQVKVDPLPSQLSQDNLQEQQAPPPPPANTINNEPA